MASKLSIYNDALLILGERKLGSVTENRPVRYKLDSAWDADLLDSIVEDADWNCFIKSVQVDYDPSLEPEFGYGRVHNMPDDLLKISGVYSDSDMQLPLTDHMVEGRHFFSSLDTIYIRYIPNDVLGDIESWPAYFSRYVAAELAKQVAPDLKNSTDHNRILGEWRMRERTAKSKDAMRAPSRRLPIGNWIRSRTLGRRYYRGRP